MGEYTPYVITSTDRSGMLVIVETMFMSWMIMVCLIRLYMRLTINGPVRVDDIAAFAGGAFGIAHVGTIMHGVSHGLGRTQSGMSASDLGRAGQALYAANVLFLAGHGAAKASVGFLLRRLGREKVYLLGCNMVLVSTALWVIASMVATTVSCAAKYQWSIMDHCHNLNIAWKAVTAFDIIIEAFLITLSVALVWSIQMRRKDKATVIFAFGTRASIIVLAIVRQTFLNDELFRSDAPLHLSDSLTVTIVLLHCSIMIATIPCLKPFIIAFNTGWGQGVANKKGTSYYKQSATSGSEHASQARGPNTSRGDQDLDLAGTRLSHESQNSRQLIIHETRQWILEESYEMHPVK
ncbi:hypothetical protein ETB97_003500 [Aspergillus alliaceus]|uniref:Rhodopsin domain-containing protein n=1 Tax=Petromyces alliaceus TaxID=209559 RepID=A0A8H6A2P2_PETAA|nr:hypothetical protein ETB97_003500 [Aspergillus burnettii]